MLAATIELQGLLRRPDHGGEYLPCLSTASDIPPDTTTEPDVTLRLPAMDGTARPRGRRLTGT